MTLIRNRDFLVFSDDWGRHSFSCRHLMSRFLPHNRMLWVQTIGLRTPRLTLYDLRRSAEKLLSWCAPRAAGGRESLPANLRLLSPVMLPFNRVPGVRALNRESVARAVSRAMRDAGMQSPILLATLPDAGDYAGRFGESLVVYYCVDDFTQWPGMDQPELVRDMENKLLAKADLVAAVSENLRATRTAAHGPTRLLTHGVDVEHFAGADAFHPDPPELAGLGRPLLGFYGLIDGRLDMDLLERVLEARPDWTVACIGALHGGADVAAGLAKLERHPNFRRVPAVPYGRLPALASRFDAAVLPYVVNAGTSSINPLKLREYIATGRPVVSTPLPESVRLKGAVRIAGGARDFIAAVEEALADTSPPALRRAALAGETWEDKARLLSAWMEEALAARAARLEHPTRRRTP